MGKPCNNTLDFDLSCACLKYKPGEPHFLLLESDHKAKMKILTKCDCRVISCDLKVIFC